MPLSLPTTDIDGGMILPFPARFYIAPQTVNGADSGALKFLGATAAGGAEFHFAKTSHNVMTEQYLNEVTSFPIKEEYTLKATFAELNLDKLNTLLGTGEAAMTLVGGLRASTSSSLTFGEQKLAAFFQLVVKGIAPPGATNAQRLIQVYKAVITSLGAIKLDKVKETGLQVTFKGLTDTGAISASKAAVLQFLDS